MRPHTSTVRQLTRCRKLDAGRNAAARLCPQGPLRERRRRYPNAVFPKTSSIPRGCTQVTQRRGASGSGAGCESVDSLFRRRPASARRQRGTNGFDLLVRAASLTALCMRLACTLGKRDPGLYHPRHRDSLEERGGSGRGGVLRRRVPLAHCLVGLSGESLMTLVVAPPLSLRTVDKWLLAACVTTPSRHAASATAASVLQTNEEKLRGAEAFGSSLLGLVSEWNVPAWVKGATQILKARRPCCTRCLCLYVVSLDLGGSSERRGRPTFHWARLGAAEPVLDGAHRAHPMQS